MAIWRKQNRSEVRNRRIYLLAVLGLLSSVAGATSDVGDVSRDRYLDNSDGRDWPGYGRTFGQQHYSPLTQINELNVGKLGLAWALDLEPLRNSNTQPIAVDGVLYFATGLSVVHAVDASNGKILWRFDPKAAERAGLNLRHGWGVRGVAWWNGKIYAGTVDGRLIAIDAKSGVLKWSVQTFEKDYPAHINSAPRVFNGKVIVGFAGEVGRARGYVTTYDAETGRTLWRFYTVPGNPADGFETKAMAMAAKTWAGQWWRFGGGAAVWNSISYDSETDTIFIGTADGYPANRRVRSSDQGNNLFVASIVALNATTGEYKWHYQTTPGDTWDYDAVMDIQLADLMIAGKARKVLMQAPKNGFFYVIDRLTGELISAAPYAKVTWASEIDRVTGRPRENAGARYPHATEAEIWPSGWGAHSWMPMAYSPKTKLVYIPQIESGEYYSDKGIDLKNWIAPTDRADEFALVFGRSEVAKDGTAERKVGTIKPTGFLLAWNPVAQRSVWKVSHPTLFNGGLLATGGDLVFQGTIDGTFKAYSASTGELLWSFDAGAPLMATPISYSLNGGQYVTILTGLGMGIGGAAGEYENRYSLDARSQARRVLTFKLGANGKLPRARSVPSLPVDDSDYREDQRSAAVGQAIYNRLCGNCHGGGAIAVIQAPDLRRSSIPLSDEAFANIVRDGRLVLNGMPAFPELTQPQLTDLRQYLRSEMEVLRKAPKLAH